MFLSDCLWHLDEFVLSLSYCELVQEIFDHLRVLNRLCVESERS